MAEEDKNKKSEVSRRDFLIGAGAVVVSGAIGAGVLAGCSGTNATETVTSTKTVTSTVTTTAGTGQTVTKTVTGSATTVTTTVGGALPYLEPERTGIIQVNQNVLAYDIKNGRAIRVRRVHYGMSYTLTARGKTFTSPDKSTPCGYYLAHRTRVTSPNRVLYPLKRVDWEPGGDPARINAQNRGVSNYVRISWNEAVTILANELKRVADKYGTEAISDAS